MATVDATPHLIACPVSHRPQPPGELHQTRLAFAPGRGGAGVRGRGGTGEELLAEAAME